MHNSIKGFYPEFCSKTANVLSPKRSSGLRDVFFHDANFFKSENVKESGYPLHYK